MLSVSGNPKLKKTTTKAKAAAHGGVVLGEAQLKTSQGRRSSRQKEPPPPVRRSRHMHACSYLLLRRHSTWRSRAWAASCLPAAARGRHWAAIPTHTHTVYRTMKAARKLQQQTTLSSLNAVCITSCTTTQNVCSIDIYVCIG